MVGDCQALIGGKLYENGKPYEQEIAEKRVDLIKEGKLPAEARRQIEPLLVEAMLSGQNKTYTVIDGFPIYREGVKVVSVSSSETVSASPRLYWRAMAILFSSLLWQRVRKPWLIKLPTILKISAVS